MRHWITRIAALGAVSAVLAGGAARAEGAVLVPHRAVYDLSLIGAPNARGVESARGRIAFDFTGDACEGYALNYRQVTVLEGGETGTRVSDLKSATFETGDGTSFRFRSESDMQGRSARRLVGDAERRDGVLSVRIAQPKAERFTSGGDPVFPTDHMKRLIEAAQAGRTTLSLKVFDGSDDGRKVYDTLAVIGRRIEPGAGAPVEPPLRTGDFEKLPRWPVTLSYFAPDRGEQTPIYTISFELYENGVSRDLRLDYGTFALKGELSQFELMPASACQR